MGHWSSYFLLFGVGSVAGVLNVVAGGGSFLTLPVLIFLGLPPTVANGTTGSPALCRMWEPSGVSAAME